MKALLDTQAFLWTISRERALSPAAYRAIEDPSTELLLSAVSAWEIVIKVGLGKLRLGGPPESYVPAQMAIANIPALPVTLQHALRVAALPLHHRDPFDRLLIAQDQVERIPIITSDPEFADYDVQVLW